MFQSVKAGFGQFMAGFHAGLVPTTPQVHSFAHRSLEKSIVWAPSRMIDSAEEMLAAWNRNDTHGHGDPEAATRPPDLPVIIVAFARDYSPTGRDYTRQIANRTFFSFPSDPKQRAFGLRTIAGDLRAQIAIFAHDPETAGSLASQFGLYLDRVEGRRYAAVYHFAGCEDRWPVQIETPEILAANVATEAKNLTINVVDLTLKATIPLFDAPPDDAPHDGQGTDGNPDDPHGYLMVRTVRPSSGELPR